MSLTTIRTEIKNKLESINSVGKVQDYRRHNIDWAKIAENFIENNKLNAWIIEWNLANQTKVASGSLAVNRIHNFTVWGLYGLKDSVASAKTFENIAEEVLDEFTKTQKLGTLAVRWPDDSLPALIANDEFQFSVYLCHRAEISLTYEELLSFT